MSLVKRNKKNSLGFFSYIRYILVVIIIGIFILFFNINNIKIDDQEINSYILKVLPIEKKVKVFDLKILEVEAKSSKEEGTFKLLTKSEVKVNEDSIEDIQVAVEKKVSIGMNKLIGFFGKEKIEAIKSKYQSNIDMVKEKLETRVKEEARKIRIVNLSMEVIPYIENQKVYIKIINVDTYNFKNSEEIANILKNHFKGKEIYDLSKLNESKAGILATLQNIKIVNQMSTFYITIDVKPTFYFYTLILLSIFVLLLRESGIWAIMFYRKYLSKRKKYKCAKGHVTG